MQTSGSLTLPNVNIALQHLTSGSPHIKEAEGALLSWQEDQTSAYAYLLLCAACNPQVRLAALLSLKAVIVRAWKDRGRSNRQLLEEVTKQQVRYFLLSIVTTGEHLLIQHEQRYQTQYNVTLAVHDRTVQSAASSCLVQVARLDLPKQFNDLVPSLVSYALASEHGIMQRRNSLYALEAILEELSQKRLLGDKQYMRVIATDHVAALVQEGQRLISMLLYDISVDSTYSEMILNLIRILHLLLQSSLSSLLQSRNEASAAVDQWMKLTLDFSSACIAERSSGSLTDALSSLCIELWDLAVDVQQAHPIAFGRFLEPFLIMYYNALFLGREETRFLRDPHAFLQYYQDRITQPSLLSQEQTILALRFLANVASSSHYVPDETQNEAVPLIQSVMNAPRTTITAMGDFQQLSSDVQQAVNAVWTRFFSSECVCNVMDLCVGSLMTIPKDRLIDWAADPESFFFSEEHRTAEDDVSAAAQTLFCGLVESLVGRQVVLPRLVAMLNDSESQMQACKLEVATCTYESSQASDSAHPSVVLWEALYTAAGLSASMLNDFNVWNFEAWYRGVLSPSLSFLLANNTGVYSLPILRRRIIWLIGCNISGLSEDTGVYNSMVEIIAIETCTQNDIAVKLSAAQVISMIVGNFEDVADECVTHAEFTVNSLYRLASECDELESQSAVLDTISLVLSYLIGTGRDVTLEVANASVAPLPSIWDASRGGRVLIRRNVISILVAIVSSVGPTGVEQLLQIALPIIDSSLDKRTRAEHSFLFDETLLLWLTIVRFTESYAAILGTVFPLLIGVLEIDFEHLRIAMMIAETYIMLGGQVFLAAQAESLCNLLDLTLAKVRPRGARYVSLVLEALLRECPCEGGLLLLRSGLLETMLRSCALNYVDDRRCEPDRVIAIYLNSFARILFASPGILDSLLPLGASNVTSDSFGYSELLRLYLKGMNCETNNFSLCLWLKFLLSLLPFNDPPPESSLLVALVDLMVALVVSCVEVLPRVRHVRIPGHCQVEFDSDEETIDAGTERYEVMLRNSHSKDVFNQIELNDLIAKKLMYLCNSDDAGCQAIRNRMDPTLLSSLNQVLT